MATQMQLELILTLRNEARFRPTIWGDARPLLIEAAKEIERLSDEVATLRYYGNNDCTAQADEYIEWCKTNNLRPMQEIK